MIFYHRHFKKNFKKQDRLVQVKVLECVVLLESRPLPRFLNHHKLKGDFLGFYSVNITGDYRLIFEYINEDIRLYKIGTHSELYK